MRSPIRARKGDVIYRTKKAFARSRFALAMSVAALAILSAGAVLLARSRPVAGENLAAERLTGNTAELPIHAAAISPTASGSRIRTLWASICATWPRARRVCCRKPAATS